MPAGGGGRRDKAHVFILRSKSAFDRPQNQQDVILIKPMLKRR